MITQLALPDTKPNLAFLAGLGAPSATRGRAGFGVPGPYGAVPAKALEAGTYEISGTQVFLRDEPKLDSMDSGAFNAEHGPNNNIVVGKPDLVDFDGQVGNANGYTWAHVTAKTGILAGQSGYVAVAYMAPVGWTKEHGKTSPTPATPGGIGDDPKFKSASVTTSTETAAVTAPSVVSKYTVPILVGAGVVGAGIIGWALLAKPKRARHARR